MFKRRVEALADDLGLVLLQGQDMLKQTALAHSRQWGLGSAQRWDLDQSRGSVRWTFPERVAEAPVQVLGTHGSAGGSWLWAWANESLLPPLRAASEKVRDWGRAHGHVSLTTPKLEGISDKQAADLAAIAFRLTNATGFYRAPAGSSSLYLTFGAVTFTHADGHQEKFAINLD